MSALLYARFFTLKLVNVSMRRRRVPPLSMKVTPKMGSLRSPTSIAIWSKVRTSWFKGLCLLPRITQSLAKERLFSTLVAKFRIEFVA